MTRTTYLTFMTIFAAMPELSIIITAKNEEENILPLTQAIRQALTAIDYEVIWVDDGSTDQTKNRVLENADERTILVELEKNYGQSCAMTAGIDHSSGYYIAMLDGDGQNDPADIPMMLELMKKENWDMVAGNRKNRKDGRLLRKIPSRIANALIRHVTRVYIKDYGCTLKLFKREIALKLKLSGGLHRFIPVLVHRMGTRITQVDVRHHPRVHGKGKYGLGRTFKVINDLWRLMVNRNRKDPLPQKDIYTVRNVYHGQKKIDIAPVMVQ